MDIKPQSKNKGDVAGRLLQKLLMPIVAAAAISIGWNTSLNCGTPKSNSI